MAKAPILKTAAGELSLRDLQQSLRPAMPSHCLSAALGADPVTSPQGIMRTLSLERSSEGAREVTINFWLRADRMELRHEGHSIYRSYCDNSIGEALREAFSKMGFKVIRRIYE